ncbi:skeleton-binding protein 1 [Plasmodium gonderi]|uniref:Skeleton-binding protein 1 n=1 Tax=Plasmodium gonderi TaxID=77519 RepID=A0A1Y1JGA4_PLAGO|nr:skeleton-binding protein 1 [Plasmodium gonderi]GAW81551.1 skeleton-binding protein 1 [Plasmodium gonderi]
MDQDQFPIDANPIEGFEDSLESHVPHDIQPSIEEGMEHLGDFDPVPDVEPLLDENVFSEDTLENIPNFEDNVHDDLADLGAVDVQDLPDVDAQEFQELPEVVDAPEFQELPEVVDTGDIQDLPEVDAVPEFNAEDNAGLEDLGAEGGNPPEEPILPPPDLDEMFSEESIRKLREAIENSPCYQRRLAAYKQQQEALGKSIDIGPSSSMISPLYKLQFFGSYMKGMIHLVQNNYLVLLLIGLLIINVALFYSYFKSVSSNKKQSKEEKIKKELKSKSKENN